MIEKWLMSEFLKRKKANPLFSFRSFAKRLGIDSSYLHKIMTGKRTIKESFLMHAIDVLKVDKETSVELLNELSAQKTGKNRKKGAIPYLENEFAFRLEPETQEVLFSLWLKDIDHNVPSISKASGVSPSRVEEILTGALMLGIIEEVDGRFQRVIDHNRVPPSKLSKSLEAKRVQSIVRHCELAKRAAEKKLKQIHYEDDTNPLEQFLGFGLAVNRLVSKKHLERIIRKAHRLIIDELNEVKGFEKPDTVINLAIHTYRLIESPSNKK